MDVGTTLAIWGRSALLNLYTGSPHTQIHVRRSLHVAVYKEVSVYHAVHRKSPL